VFSREADFEVCGEAENGREAIEEAQESFAEKEARSAGVSALASKSEPSANQESCGRTRRNIGSHLGQNRSSTLRDIEVP